MTQAPALCLLAFLAVVTPCLCQSAEVELIEGVEMGDSLETVLPALEGQCESTSVFEEPRPRYPLAGQLEVHLLCKGWFGGPLDFESAAFVIADGQLVQMEASGVDQDIVQRLLGVPDGEYLHMDNFRQGTVWMDTHTDRLLWLSMEARHPNLFAWPNPHLGAPVEKPQNESTQIPALLNFSSSLETLRPLFQEQCDQIVIHENERVWLPDHPSNQVQIDCFGFAYAGFERKLEAVFGDGKLQVIWVLTGKPEESRLRARLVEDWGQPSLVNDNWEVFGNGRISLRKDKPEFLILSDEMIPLYRDEFGG